MVGWSLYDFLKLFYRDELMDSSQGILPHKTVKDGSKGSAFFLSVCIKILACLSIETQNDKGWK